MFEATVRDSSDELVFQQEVAETRRVYADVAAFLVCAATHGEIALSCSGVAVGGGLGRLNLLIGVVNEIFLVRHGDFEAGKLKVSLLFVVGDGEVVD